MNKRSNLNKYHTSEVDISYNQGTGLYFSMNNFNI